MGKAVTRRVVVNGVLGVGGAAALGGCGMSGSGEYDAVLAEQTRALADDPDAAELVRYATLAANSHNTQPWRFRVDETSIDILPDETRRTPIADPDDHHLYASLGCAAENLGIAARASGRSGEVVFDAAGNRVRIALTPAPREASPLFAAIPRRQCARATYDGSTVAADLLARLVAAASIEGVEPVVVTDAAQREDVLALIVAGNTRQFDDPAFRDELKAWLRYNPAAAAAKRDGLFSAASGNPTLPTWLGPLMFDWFTSTAGENDKTIEQVRSSSGLIVFVGPSDDKAGWVAAGRACQRFALQATLEGLKHAFVNQAVEVADVRKQLQARLDLGSRRPDLIVRFGRGPDMPRSLRRNVRDVLANQFA